MAVCGFAELKLLPWATRTAPIAPTVHCLHSAVTPAGYNLYGQWLSGGIHGDSCHFYIRVDGRLEQYIDTGHAANAQYEGNAYCVSTETEGMDPDHNPWTPAQLATMTRLHDWLHDVHGISDVTVNQPRGPGVGWHSMWSSPPHVIVTASGPLWNHDRHSCPGAARIAQIPGWVASLSVTPQPGPHPGEEDVATARFVRRRDQAAVYVTDGAMLTRRHIASAHQADAERYVIDVDPYTHLLAPPPGANTEPLGNQTVWVVEAADVEW